MDGDGSFFGVNQYLELVRDVLANGVAREDRTGVGTRGVFGRQARFDLQVGFPLVTTKKVHWHSIVHELLWFLRGETNVRTLHENKVTIWDEWADEDGELGPIYGRQWRAWPAPDGRCVDQLREVIEEIRRAPWSRRLVVSAWNVADLPRMRMAPCHVLFQFYVQDGVLSCQLYQRSADVFLGVPFNIASYALLTHLVAAVCGLRVGEFVHVFGDLHLYQNHVRQAKTQLARTPFPLPMLELSPSIVAGGEIDAVGAEDILLRGYRAHPAIRAAVAV